MIEPTGSREHRVRAGAIKCKPGNLAPALGSLEGDSEAEYFNLCFTVAHRYKAICQIHYFFKQSPFICKSGNILKLPLRIYISRYHLCHRFAISSRSFKEERVCAFKKIILTPVGVSTTGDGDRGRARGHRKCVGISS